MLRLSPQGFSLGVGAVSPYRPYISYNWSTVPVSDEYKTDGVELVVNWDFSDGINNFEAINTAIISEDAHRLKINILGSGDGFTQPSTPDWEEGKTYIISFDSEIETFTGSTITILAGTDTVGIFNLEDNTPIVYHRTSTSSINGIIFKRSDASTGTIFFDNISVQKVTQLPNNRYLTNQGTFDNAPIYSGRAMAFDSANSTSVSIDEITLSGDFTFSCFSDWDGASFDIMVGGLSDYFGIANATQLVLKGDSYYYIDLISSLDTGTVYAINFKRVGTVIYAYINGIEYGNATCGTETISIYSIGKYSSAYKTGELSNIIFADYAFTQAQITEYYEQPEKFLMENKDSFVEAFPMLDDDEFVRGVVGYSEVELLNDQFDDNSNNWLLKSSTTISSGSLNFDGTLNGELARISNIGLLNHSIILIKYNLTAYTQGALNVKIGGGLNYLLSDYTLGYKYQIIADGILDNFQFAGGSNLIASISDIEIIGLSGIYPITNWVTGMNKTGLPYGLQSSKLEIVNNVPIAYNTDKLSFYGSEYVDTGWIPSADEDWTIEVISRVTDNGTKMQSIFGVSDGNEVLNLSYFYYLNRLQVQFGSSASNDVLVLGGINLANYNYIVISYAHLTKTLSFNYNNTGFSGRVVDAQNIGYTLGLGAFNTSNTYTQNQLNPIKLFKVHKDKALTQEEITDNYIKYLEQGLFGDSVKAPAMIDYTGFSYLDTLSEYVTDGIELVANGGFDSGLTGWSYSSTYSVVDNQLNITGSDSYLSMSNVFEIGSTYKVSYEVISTSGGNFNLRMPSTSNYYVANNIGVHVIYVTATLTGLIFRNESTVGTMIVGNISIQKVVNPEITPDTRYIENKGDA